MQMNDSYLRNTWRPIPGSFVSNLPQQRGFGLNHQQLSSGIPCERVQLSSDDYTYLEYMRYRDAASKGGYLNQETLIPQLQTPLNMLHGTRGGLHACSNGSLSNTAFQRVDHGSIYKTNDYCAVATNNEYGIPKGGLSHPSIVHELILSPNQGTSITTCADMDLLRNFYDSGGGSNLKASSKSISSSLLDTDLLRYRDCSGTIQSEILMTPQQVSSRISEVSNLYPGLSSTSGLEGIMQYQPQELDYQQNFKHSMQQPYELGVEASLAQSSSCFVDQGEHFCHMLGQKTLNQPQLPTMRLNGDEKFTSISSAGLSGVGYANLNPCNGSGVSVEQMILPECFHYKNSNIGLGNDEISFVKYLHSEVCSKGTCTCEQSFKLLFHFKSCQSDDCHLCRPWKSSRVTDNFEHHLEIPSNMLMNKTARDSDNDAMVPPTKRPRMESASGVSLINNASSDRCTQEMDQPYIAGTLLEVVLQHSSPLSSNNSEVIESSSEHFTNPMLDSMSITTVPPTKRQKMESALGVSLTNNANSDRWTQEMDQPYIAGTLLEVLQRSSPPSSVNSEVTECSAERCTSPVLDYISISDIKNNAIDGTLGKAFKSGTFPSKGLQAGQIQEEPDPGDHDMIDSNSVKEIGVRLNSTAADVEDIQGRTGNNQAGTNATNKVSEPKADQEKETKSSNTTVSEIKNNVIDDTFGQTFKCEMIPSKGLEADQISEKPDLKSHDVIDSSNLKEIGTKSNSSTHTLSKDPIPSDAEDIQVKSGFNQDGTNAEKKTIEAKADQEKETKSSNKTVNIVSLTEYFTRDQIKEHIMSLRKQFVQGTTEEETGVAGNTCQLCATEKLFFAPVPIYCLCCGIRVKRNANYFCRKEEEFDEQRCFCCMCYRKSKGGCITFNGTSVSKTLLEKRKNDEVIEEAWVECNECRRWQHQICALYNNKRDLDCSAEYICPVCRLKEIENGMHIPLPKTAFFGAKDLPSTMLSDHIEKRLFERLLQERADWTRVKGNEILDEVLAAENLSVRVVLSVDKQLKVKDQFRDIFLDDNYPTEFSYRTKVIVLFQKIEGADVCLFVMYVQEFGSECGNPNQRSVYISYLDSVKYFRPERNTMSGEALRTFVYHEILIGYLDFCKKRGFTTGYIWACPPLRGEDYILYCHPDTQKTPKNDKLRHWYHSMLRKAAEEKIVVGLTNMYDEFFVPNGKFNTKVTAARLPYFDGDYWSGAAMDLAKKVEQESRGDYEKALKKLVSNRTLKAMGHVNPSKGTAKDILVMQRLGQILLPVKEDFIVAQLQYACMHCHQFIVSGKRWFCSECKKFQECERCHTSDSHTSISGEIHTLSQVLVDDIPFSTKEKDVIPDNGLMENRHKFLSFCQNNQFQFDTLRRAKYSSMMILHHLKNRNLLTAGTTCRICSTHNASQQSWKCESCPECNVCSACYKERGAECHEHKLSLNYSATLSLSENQELKEDPMMELLDVVMQHASRCSSIKVPQCPYPNCLEVKKLFSHAKRCTIRKSGGCRSCIKVWEGIHFHSSRCQDPECRIPRCKDVKKNEEWKAMQSESRRRAAVGESNGTETDH